ncbi:MAG: multidrug effflux MFS transporter [Candidatus Melainabacteria bacterium]|nr:multidrug effflux MFS transporter [Candidatus Melainabacteria bacterium]
MNRKEIKFLFLVIVVFVAACIETDIYLPAFPDMMAWFGASEGAIQGLLTWNFVGICLSGPLYGPISDAFGRKKPILVALGLFLFGSIMTLFAQNLDQMLWGRILQGLGSGGCFTLGTAIIFDAFQKERAIRATNNLNTIVPLIMAAAPMLGGYLNYNYGFRSNFLAIGIFVLISLLICVFFFEETLPKEKRTPFAFKTIAAAFKEAFCCLPFWQLTLVTSFLFAGYIAFLSGTAVLFVVEFGMSKAVFPVVQAAILGGWVAGSLLLDRVVAKWGNPKIKRAGLALCVLGGLELALTALGAPRDPYLLTFGMVLYALGANWIIGLYFPEAMEILTDIKGIAASLLTSARLLIAALVVGLSSSLYNATAYPLIFIVLGTLVYILPTLILYERKKARVQANS